jgi:hypothetical protein
MLPELCTYAFLGQIWLQLVARLTLDALEMMDATGCWQGTAMGEGI